MFFLSPFRSIYRTLSYICIHIIYKHRSFSLFLSRIRTCVLFFSCPFTCSPAYKFHRLLWHKTRNGCARKYLLLPDKNSFHFPSLSSFFLISHFSLRYTYTHTPVHVSTRITRIRLTLIHAYNHVLNRRELLFIIYFICHKILSSPFSVLMWNAREIRITREGKHTRFYYISSFFSFSVSLFFFHVFGTTNDSLVPCVYIYTYVYIYNIYNIDIIILHSRAGTIILQLQTCCRTKKRAHRTSEKYQRYASFISIIIIFIIYNNNIIIMIIIIIQETSETRLV